MSAASTTLAASGNLLASRVSDASADSASTPRGSPLDGWRELRYTTSKLLVFTGELKMTRSPSADKIAVKTESQARLFGSPFVDTWSVSTMDRKTGRPLEFFDVRPGKKAERWALAGPAVLHTTLKPHEQSRDEPIEKWRASKTKTVEAPPSNAASTTTTSGSSSGSPGNDSSQWVHDYISMIVRLHDLPLERKGDEARVRVLTSRGPVPMRIRVSEERTTHRTLNDLSKRQSRKLDLKELRLRVTPMAGSPSDTKGFMNMEGETELWVDSVTRTLTEISGDVPKVPGRVVITLSGYR